MPLLSENIYTFLKRLPKYSTKGFFRYFFFTVN